MIEFNYTLFIQFFQLLVLLVLLDLFLFKPVLGSLKKRRGAIDSLAGKAEDSRQEADALAKTYGESVKERKAPVLAQREGALKEAHAASMKIIEEARRELAGELAKVKETVKKEAENTLDALLGESDRLALEIAQKIGKRGR
jgi:F-type H+-transporting ATPase subunit b